MSHYPAAATAATATASTSAPMASSAAKSASKEKSRNEAHQEAFEKAVQAVSLSMPLLLHGSGDVTPTQVNPKTVHLLSTLTVQYIEKLATAALEAHYTFLSDANGNNEYKVPPPSFPRHDMPQKPPPFSVTHPPDKTSTPSNAAEGKNAGSSVADLLSDLDKISRERPKKRLREEYWDDDLPKPKIKSKGSSEPATKAANATTAASNVATSLTAFNTDPSLEQLPPQADLREWVGSMGVDLRSNYIRKAHVKNAIGTKSFVFCVCHDVYAYNRVREIRAAKRTVDPILQDSVLTDLMATEGRIRLHPTAKGRAKKEDDPQEEEEIARQDEEGGSPEWPGLDYVLPVHMLKDYPHRVIFKPTVRLTKE